MNDFKCLKYRCFSPGACGGFGYCRELNFVERPANTEMIQGFMDGYDLTAPEPSSNRSASYRHGFMCARIDKRVILENYSAGQLRKMADDAMAQDDIRAIQ